MTHDRYKDGGVQVDRYSPRGALVVIRIREILDLELKQQVIAALAERRGMSPAAIPEWFELDDADFVDLLNDLKEQNSPETQRDPRE